MNLSPVFRSVLPWVMAAALALCAAWFALLYTVSRSESALLRDQAALVEVARLSSHQQLEAERIIARRQLATPEQSVATANTQLASAGTPSPNPDRPPLTATGDPQDRVELTTLKISALVSMQDHSPKPLAVVVWDPAKQAGVLQVQKLPTLPSLQDYKLWIVDPQYSSPIDCGVFAVHPETGDARLVFRPKQPVGVITAFAVTLERRGEAQKAGGSLVLQGK